MAFKMGDGWFTGGSGDMTEYDKLIHKAGEQVLSNLQKLISQLVKTRDGSALSALQTCCGTLFKRASECMAADKDMEIKE